MSNCNNANKRRCLMKRSCSDCCFWMISSDKKHLMRVQKICKTCTQPTKMRNATVLESNMIDTAIKKRYIGFLNNENYTDCCFLVGTSENKRVIRAHKILLALGSLVFEKMLFGDLSPPNNEPIEVTDIDPEIFDMMVKYIYLQEITIENFDEACSLAYVAEKYMLPKLFKLCRNNILNNLSTANVCRAYELAKMFNKPKFMGHCMNFIIDNTTEILWEPSFSETQPGTLLDILDQEQLAVRESDLFDVLLNYVHGAGNSTDAVDGSSDTENKSTITKKRVIDETIVRQAIKKIRFLIMTPQEFANGAACSNLLTRDEVLSILLKLQCPNKTNLKVPDGFSESKKKRFGRSDEWKFGNYKPRNYLMEDDEEEDNEVEDG